MWRLLPKLLILEFQLLRTIMKRILGQKNRAVSLIDDIGDLFVGIESGLITRENILFEECWCVMVDRNKNEWVGISSSIKVPDVIINDMNNGISHVESINNLADKLNLSNKDTWGVYSKGSLSRLAGLFEASRNALLFAVVPRHVC